MRRPPRSLTMFALCLAALCSAAAADEYGDLAKKVLEAAPRKVGLCVVVGGDTRLALAIARDTKFMVFTRPSRIDAAAVQEALNAGLLNKKLYVDAGATNVIPLADNYADLLVVYADAGTPREEAMRALSPNGSGFILTDGALAALPAKALPDGAADWPHWFYGPDNNPVSPESALKWPFLMQWLGKPYRGAQPKVTVVSAGRAFCASGEAYSTYHTSSPHEKADAHWLKAINVFNGQLLWKRKLRTEDQIGRPAFIATPETFYMIERHRILCLDPETGAEQKAIDLGGEKRMPKWIALRDGVLYAMLGDPEVYGEKWRSGQKYPIANMSNNKTYSPEGTVKPIWGFGNEIVAYDLNAARKMWSHKEDTPDIDARQCGVAACLADAGRQGQVRRPGRAALQPGLFTGSRVRELPRRDGLRRPVHQGRHDALEDGEDRHAHVL